MPKKSLQWLRELRELLRSKEIQNTAANPFFDCLLLKRLRPFSDSTSVEGECFWRVCRLLGPQLSPGGESKSILRGVLAMVDCRSLNTSSPVDVMDMLCEIAISRALSSVASHSSAMAIVAEPSDEADFGSSNIKCFSC